MSTIVPSVKVSNNYDTHGSVSRAKVKTLSPELLKKLFNQPSREQVDISNYFKRDANLEKIYPRNGNFYGWLTNPSAALADQKSGASCKRAISYSVQERKDSCWIPVSFQNHSCLRHSDTARRR